MGGWGKTSVSPPVHSWGWHRCCMWDAEAEAGLMFDSNTGAPAENTRWRRKPGPAWDAMCPCGTSSLAWGARVGWISHLICSLATSEAVRVLQCSQKPVKTPITKALPGGWYAPKGLKFRFGVWLDQPWPSMLQNHCVDAHQERGS